MTTRHENFAIFCAKILSDLYEEFPVPARLDRKEAVALAFDFDEWEERRRELSTRAGMRDILAMAVESEQIPDEERVKFEQMLRDEGGLKKEAELKNELQTLREKSKEVSAVWDGTLTFLESEGYVRSAESLWQLTEKGFGHLSKKFTDSKIEDSKGTFFQKFREQLSDPSKMAAQTLLQAVGALPGVMGG